MKVVRSNMSKVYENIPRRECREQGLVSDLRLRHSEAEGNPYTRFLDPRYWALNKPLLKPVLAGV